MTIINNILGDNYSSVELLSYMGSDLTIVNNARVSFGNQQEALTLKDEKLIAYLIKHKHWSPFRGVVFQFRASVPLYIAAQWQKHSVASSYLDSQNQWNQISLRYVEAGDRPYYTPTVFSKQSKSNKQASEGTLSTIENKAAREAYGSAIDNAFEQYQLLIDLGVSREQARGILPTATYTSFIWTVSLQALLNFISLRKGEGAQNEIALYADALVKLAQPIVPLTFKYFGV